MSPEFSNQRKRVDYGRPHAPQSRLREQLKFIAIFFCTVIGGYYALSHLVFASLPAQKAVMQAAFNQAQSAYGTTDEQASKLANVPVDVEIDRKCVPDYRKRLINQGFGSHGSMVISMNSGMLSDDIEIYWATNGDAPGARLKPQEVAGYFRCAMTEKIERYCDEGQRRRLVTQLLSLLDFRTRALGALDHAGLHRPFGSTMTDREYANATRRARNEVNGWIGSIGPQLRYLSQSGYLSARDFGFFERVPELLQPYVVAKLQDRCA
jgi:hypothetical protein